MSQIQNAGLGEFKIRDLNDEINKALREKRHWENRILELGGRDMRRRSRMLDKEGKEVPGVHGYKYFGAARDLPGKICKTSFHKGPDQLVSKCPFWSSNRPKKNQLFFFEDFCPSF